MSLELLGSQPLIVITTEGNHEKARNLAKSLLEMKLAACIGLNKINSIYWWQNKLIENSEVQLNIKTKYNLLDKLFDTVKELHSYEVPEFIYFNPSSSNEYYRWINSIDN